jgi:transcriptional regulator with XRE-family HTH domain
MLRARQIRAARALVGLSQLEIAKLAGVGIATVRRIEASVDDLSGTAQSVSRIERALVSAGIMFIDQDERRGPGVRLRKPLP